MTKGREANPLPQVLWIFILLFSSLCSTYIFWPGFMSDDSFQQLQEALSGKFTSDHPATMSWLWRQLLPLSSSDFPQAPMLVFHQILFFGAVGVYASARYPLSKLKSSALISLLIFYPAVLGLMGNIWKDVGMANALFMSLALVLSGHRKKSLKIALWALPFMIYASSVRHNAPLSLLPLSIFLFVGFKKRFSAKQIFLYSTLSSLLVVGAGITAGKILTNGNDKHFISKYTLFDLAGISHFERKVILPDYQLPRDLDDIEKIYKPKTNVMLFHVNSGNPLHWPTTPEEIEATTTKWRESLLRYPVSYLKHRIKVSAAVLGMTKEVYYPYHMNIRGGEPNFLGLPNPPNALRKNVTTLIDKISQSVLFRGWLYIGLNLLFIVLSLRRKTRDDSFYLLTSASGLFSVLMLLPMTGAGDFRYLIWSMLTALLLSLDYLLEPSPQRI